MAQWIPMGKPELNGRNEFIQEFVLDGLIDIGKLSIQRGYRTISGVEHSEDYGKYDITSLIKEALASISETLVTTDGNFSRSIGPGGMDHQALVDLSTKLNNNPGFLARDLNFYSNLLSVSLLNPELSLDDFLTTETPLFHPLTTGLPLKPKLLVHDGTITRTLLPHEKNSGNTEFKLYFEIEDYDCAGSAFYDKKKTVHANLSK